LIGHGDPLGIHVHPYRWDEERSVAFSDHADNAWTTHCLTVAAEAFAYCFGEPVRRACQGGAFLTETVLDAEIAAGIEVDVTAESGLPPKTTDPSFGAYASAPSGDFRDCPRRPYPSRDRLAVPSSSLGDGRPILIVPLTAYDYHTALQSWPRRFAKRLLGRPRYHLPLNPWKAWPSPKIYWDLVAQAADDQPACYFAFAIRTDTPGSVTHEWIRQLLEYLPNHPVAKRLHLLIRSDQKSARDAVSGITRILIRPPTLHKHFFENFAPPFRRVMRYKWPHQSPLKKQKVATLLTLPGSIGQFFLECH
jgi:hypothetical protein